MKRGAASQARRRGVVSFVLAAGAVVFAMGWLSFAFVGVDYGARDNALRQEALRLALWRADSWAAPLLASEAARDPEAYDAFPSEDDSMQLPEGVHPSPLMDLHVPYVALWFEVDEADTWTSPQLPRGDQRERAMSLGRLRADEPELLARLDEIKALIDLARVREEVGAGVEEFQLLIGSNRNVIEPAPSRGQQRNVSRLADSQQEDTQWARNFNEHQLRAQTGYKAQWIAQNSFDNNSGLLTQFVDEPRVGPFLPYCLRPGDAEPLVLFLRSAVLGGRPKLQGFLANWSAVEADLIEQVVDLFKSVDIETLDPRVESIDDDDYANRVASLPVRIVAGPTKEVPPLLGENTLTTLGVAWLAMFAALAGLGFAFRASTLYAERKSRFASAVTHELRTPLTTFRMYSEMLAGDMVREEEDRKEYLTTLVQESERLGRLVENVLTWARVEEGRSEPRRERTSVRALLDRVAPALERRAMQTGALFDLEIGGDLGGRELETDIEAVGQVLFNLVDNACKYGRGERGHCRVHLSGEVAESTLTFRVRDEGPGVPMDEQGRIFRAFERGEVGERDPNSGVGLGLALSAGLARELGGRLSFEPGGGGASFRLDLPLP